MNVCDIMTARPAVIHQDQSLRDALQLMQDVGCHHLPVINDYRQIVGILSDRDCRSALNSPFVLREQWEDEALARRLPVRAIMTPAPIVVEPEAPADEAVRLMLDNRIHCLPVMRSETLVGIVTTSDLLMAFVHLYRRVHRETASSGD